MAKRKSKPLKTCADCIHEFACAMWNIGNIHNMDATNCTNYETVKDSAAYLIGLLDGRKESRMACKAKENGRVARRGKPSIEWFKDEKPQYYCYGYIDKMTDELLSECKKCQNHVDKAQDDLDEWREHYG